MGIASEAGIIGADFDLRDFYFFNREIASHDGMHAGIHAKYMLILNSRDLEIKKPRQPTKIQIQVALGIT
jgi:hypothetical protein